MFVPAEAEALSPLEPDRDGGVSAGHYALGRKLGTVGHLEYDASQSAECYRKAAQEGHREAQFALGLLYRRGDGVVQDGAESLRWIRESALRGEAAAQHELGLCYHRASLWNRPLDDRDSRVEAYMWLRLAAAQGYEGSAGARDLVCLAMNHDQVAAGNRAAAAFVALAAGDRKDVA